MIQELSAHEIEENYRELEDEGILGDSIIARALSLDGAFIAVNANRDYLFIVRDSKGDSSPSRRLRLINVDYVIKLNAEVDGVTISDNFTVVALPGRNREMLSAFCILLSLLLHQDVRDKGRTELRAVVESIIELFTPRFGNVRERAKGLFGELAVISKSASPDILVRSWHDSLNANKDFSLQNSYLEVKTSEGQARRHEIALSQLETDNTGRPINIASVPIEEDPNGMSAIDLYKEIRDQLISMDLQTKLTQQVLSTVGLDYAEFDELKFSVSGGANGIWIVSADDVPKPEIMPNSLASMAISSIRFTVDLDVLDVNGMPHLGLNSIE